MFRNGLYSGLVWVWAIIKQVRAKFPSLIKPVSSLVIGGLLLQCLSFACLACVNADTESAAVMSCCPSQHKHNDQTDDSAAQQNNCHGDVDYCSHTYSAAIDIDSEKALFQLVKVDAFTVNSVIASPTKSPNKFISGKLLSHHSEIPIYISCCSFLE